MQETWITTRDGSPTLWNHELGESYRSVKGAFTESFSIFVQEALKLAKLKREQGQDTFCIGEFGLGVGTNWLLSHIIFSTLPNLKLKYFAIEREPKIWDLGLAHWKTQIGQIQSFLKTQGFEFSKEEINRRLDSFGRPLVFSTLNNARRAHMSADYWYHDPFGYDVNSEAYDSNTLEECAHLWHSGTQGSSYACNKKFQESLGAIKGIQVQVLETPSPSLKREYLSFLCK